MKRLYAIIILILVSANFLTAQTTVFTFNSSTNWTVPSGVTLINIKVYGGAGGNGGRDCGNNCSNQPTGPVGYVDADYTVTPGDVIGVYPGGIGGAGTNDISGGGSGAAGVSSFSNLFNGGSGGITGPQGSSGGGGGGGACSLVQKNNNTIIIAGGAGGGGGAGNWANTATPGNINTSQNNSNTFGGVGANGGSCGSSDGGGGGGGGGGNPGSVGGNVFLSQGECHGYGGYRGANTLTGANIILTNNYTTWNVGGQVQISYSVMAGTATSNQTICSGLSPAAITLTGFLGSIQWQSSPNNSTWTNILGATTSTLSSIQMGVLTSTYYYRAFVSNLVYSNIVTVTVNLLPVVTASSTAAAVCAGASVTLTGGGASTYTWSGGVTNAVSFVPISTLTYTVTGTSAAGCVNTATTTVTVNPLPTVTASSSPGTICVGGTSTLTANGATTYAWMPGNLTGASITVSPTATTTYTVTGTNANGCINTATRTITVNPLPIVTATSTSAAVCTGASITLTGGGASTYSWSGGVTNAVSFIPTATTTYTVTGTNANGCLNTATITITVNPLPIVTTATTAATICIGASTTITASGATTYAWMPGNLTGATVTISPIATTTYTVTGTNANGCINTTTRIITVNPLPVVTATSTAAAVCAGASVTLSGGGATSYTWNNNVTNAVSFVPTATATYTVTGTNANACVNTATITVTVNPLPVVTATSTSAAVCNGGSVTLTGGGAVTYAWSGGVTNAVSFIPSATTTYTVTGTNSNGCVNTATTTVTVNPLPAVTANSSAASVCAGGSVTLTGGGAATYTWSNNVMNAVSFIPNSTATYTVTGTDANGCMNTAVIMVIVSTLPTVTATSTAAAVCAGASVTLTGGGAATYSWTNNVTDAVSFIPTQTITYTVTGTSSAGCVNTTTITVTVNPLPVVTATSTAAAVCAGSSVILSGGGAATYSWSGGVTNAVSFIPTATTTYTVTGTNSNGCVNTAMITVTVNPLPIVTATSTAAAVCIGGSVTLTGGGAATYSWDNNVIDAVTFVPSATMTYVVTGTDLNACINTATITVTVNPLPVVIATSTAAAVCAGASVTLTGSGASTYVWDNNVIDAVTFVPVATATYNVIGTDLNGCVNISSITVTVNISPIVSLGPDVIQCGGTVTLNAGNTGSTYLWSNLNTIQSITVSTSGIYSVVVTNTNGCIGSDLVNVIINVLPVVTGSVSANVVCVDDAVLSLVGTPIGGVWSGPGVNGLFLSPLAAGVGSHIAIYSYTDSNGCEGMASVNVQVNACVGFVENALANGVSVYPNPNNGSFTLSVNANVADLTIKITDMQGRVVYASVENNVNAGFVKQISLDTESSGMYLMHILANGEQQTKKVSVQK